MSFHIFQFNIHQNHILITPAYLSYNGYMRTPPKKNRYSFLGILISCTLFVGIMTIGGVYLSQKVVIKPVPVQNTPFLFYTAVGHIPPSSTSLPSGNFTVQLGTRGSQTEAEQYIYELNVRGIKSFYTPQVLDDRMIYLIRTGWFASQEEAKNLIATLPQDIKASVSRLE